IYEYVTTSPPVGFISITYPPTNRLYQRNASDIGAIDIYGKYTGIVYAIESRFDGGTWKNISLNPSNNEFFGQLNVSIGQGDLDIRVCGESNITTIENISVGDLYLIAGQSNAVGGGINNQIINDSNIYTPMMYSISDTWTVLKDPVGGWLGSVWVPLANTIIKETSIPIAFIPTAVSASVISEWNKGDPNYNNMISQTHEATNNTDLIKALLWYQGEGDASVNSGVQGEYTPYYTQLGQFSTDVMNDINAERVLVGQIGETGESWSIDRSGADNIRKAQQDLWDNYDNISYGCITYDINLTVDRLHFKTDIELGNFSNRWWAGLDYHIYSNTDGRAAKVLNISRSESNKIVIAMNKSIKPSNVTGNLKGFKIYNGTDDLTDSDITNASVVNGSYIELTLSSTIGTGAKLNYSSYNDANDVIIPIGTTSHETPIRPIYDESIQIQSVDSCSPPAINTNHIFDLVDNCTIDDDWDIGTGNITFINTGTITFNATIIANSIGNLPAHQRGYIGSEARVREGGG
ncbi:MAG: hypothetical protein KAS32_17960, partial [Candidatus Peribacteraceae bacterium]|nr:hypothetical protein [Candidatus Peribacteraceae bacterium]